MSNTLNVTLALKDPGQLYPFSAEASVSPMTVFGEEVRFSTVKLKGTMLGTEETVTLRAELTSEANMTCARCLGEIRIPIRVNIEERFSHEADPDEPDQYLYNGSALDLTDCVRDQVALQLPISAVCSEDCKGLCPRCGQNRNDVSCTCLEGGETANPFSALNAMVENEKEV